MTPVAEDVDQEVQAAEARAREAAKPCDALTAERRDLFAIVAECDDEMRLVEARRVELLPRAFRGDADVDGLLAQVDPHLQALRSRKQHASDAAKLLEDQIREASHAPQAAARALNELRHRRLVEAHARAAGALQGALTPLHAAIAAYVASGAAVNASHRSVYGEAEPRELYEPPAFRALRFVNIELHRSYGADARALEQLFDPRGASL